MAIQTNDGGGFLITGEHIELFQAVTIARALALECNTGMKMSRGVSVLRSANSVVSTWPHAELTKFCGFKVQPLGQKATKRGALGDLALWLIVVWKWELKPDGTVDRALGDKLTGEITRKGARINAKIRPATASEGSA